MRVLQSVKKFLDPRIAPIKFIEKGCFYVSLPNIKLIGIPVILTRFVARKRQNRLKALYRRTRSLQEIFDPVTIPRTENLDKPYSNLDVRSNALLWLKPKPRRNLLVRKKVLFGGRISFLASARQCKFWGDLLANFLMVFILWQS